MDYRLFLSREKEKTDNSLLIKAVERSKLVDSSVKSINTNPYLLRFFKKRFNRPGF